MINPSPFLSLIDRVEHMQWLHTWLEKTLLPHKYEGEISNSFPQSSSSHPLVTLILGETGAGKTRLASETSQLATKIGYHQIWINCRAIETDTPYFPFCELLQVLMYELTDEQFATLLADVGPSAVYLSVLYPPLKDGFSLQFSDGPSSDTNSIRLHLWNTLVSLMDAYRRRIGPLLLILDDLHWVDQETLGLFTHLLQSPWAKSTFNKKGKGKYKPLEKYPLLVLATAHSGLLQNNIRLRVWATQLERINLLTRLELASLTKTSVNKLVQSCIVNIDDAQVDAISQKIYDLSMGNPFFVSEFLHIYTSLDQPSDLVSPSINTPSHDLFTYYQDILNIQFLPEVIVATMEDSLTRVSAICCKWLAVASVVGNDFNFTTVRQLWRLSVDQDNVTNLNAGSKFNSEDLLDEALAAALIYEVPFMDRTHEKYPLRNKCYCFWHPLFMRYIQLRLSQPRLLHLRLLITQLNNTQGQAEAHGPLFCDSLSLSTSTINTAKTEQYAEDTIKKNVCCGVSCISLSEQPAVSKYIVPEVKNQKEIAMPLVLPLENRITSVQCDDLSNEGRYDLIRQLTPKELEILSLISAGCDTEEIIQRLYLTKATVRTHIRNLLCKLGVSSRLKAVLLWQEYENTYREMN